MSQPGGETPPPTRRRVLAEPGKEKVEGRTGCIVTGAVLGVILGIMFALYGLPPILRSIYGEEIIDPGGRYEGSDLNMGVLDWQRTTGPDVIEVRMVVQAGREWITEPSDWLLVMRDGTLVEPRGPRESRPETSLDFSEGETRELVLIFPLSPGTEGKPDYVRVSSPKVRFKLGGGG